jgi:hypothetical protein
MTLVNWNKKCLIIAGFLSIGLAFSPLISQSFAQFAPLPPDSSGSSKDCSKKTSLKETDGMGEGSLLAGAIQTTQEVNVGIIHTDEKEKGTEPTVLNSNGKAIPTTFFGSETSIQTTPRGRQ